MQVIRRVYTYLLALVGVGLLSLSVANLASTLLDVALAAPPAAASERFVREQTARWAAGAVVGLPVWALHWWWAQRGAGASPSERASALRRLYLYLVLAGATLAAASSAHTILAFLFELVQGFSAADSGAALRAVPFLLVAAAIWPYHWRVAAADRAAVGERVPSATIRRWYVYGAALLGLLALLDGASNLLEGVWRFAVAPERGSAGPSIGLPQYTPTALVGLAVWLVHWRWWPRALDEASFGEDRASALRSVYLFLALAVAVASTLAGLSQLLFFGLARALGVERPAGVGGNVLEAAAGPGSAAAIYGIAWLYARAAIRQQAERGTSTDQQGIRRFYTYLVALLALAALAGGVGGLLWTLADVATSAAGAFDRREQAARFATLALVGLPVWLAHWRPSSQVDADEAQALSRRLYGYLALIGSALVLVGSAVTAVYLPLTLVLGAGATSSLLTDLTHALSLALVAATVAAYHWRQVRADARRQAAAPLRAGAGAPPVGQPPAELLVRLRAREGVALDEVLSALRRQGIEVEVLPAET